MLAMLDFQTGPMGWNSPVGHPVPPYPTCPHRSLNGRHIGLFQSEELTTADAAQKQGTFSGEETAGILTAKMVA